MLSRLGPLDTGVSCPDCRDGTLVLHRFCVRTTLQCSRCRVAFSLADLAGRLGDEPFERLAEAVGDRLSDRV